MASQGARVTSVRKYDAAWAWLVGIWSGKTGPDGCGLDGIHRGTRFANGPRLFRTISNPLESAFARRLTAAPRLLAGGQIRLGGP
jgi:hypothetical protein